MKIDHDICLPVMTEGESTYIQETVLPLDRANFLDEVSDVDDLVAVIELNPAEGWARDISEDMARVWLDNFIAEGGDLEGIIPDFIRDNIPDFETVISETLGQQATEEAHNASLRYPGGVICPI